jgi:hypothetical protein
VILLSVMTTTIHENLFLVNPHLVVNCPAGCPLMFNMTDFSMASLYYCHLTSDFGSVALVDFQHWDNLNMLKVPFVVVGNLMYA